MAEMTRGLLWVTAPPQRRVFAKGLSDAVGEDPLQSCYHSLIFLNTKIVPVLSSRK